MQPQLTLAIETSSRIGSVALALGGQIVGKSTFSASLRHSAEIFPTIGDLLRQTEQTAKAINQVHISVGPGSFTGLRIAVAAAKSMHLANSTQIVTVNSLDTIAAKVKDVATASPIQETPNRLATILDAKRGQFYVAVYARSNEEPNTSTEPGYQIPAPKQGYWHKILPDCLLSASEITDRFANPTTPLYLTGDGLLYHKDKFNQEGIRILDPACWSPHATQVHTLGHQKACRGQFADPLTLEPFYLRGPQVTLRKTASPDHKPIP